jgi:hypothetical protein
MELIQIIESTVFIFSLGLIVLLVLSYLLFKVKNRSASFPLIMEPVNNIKDKIIYEQNPTVKKNEDPELKKVNKRFIVLNEALKTKTLKSVEKKPELTTRFYIYKPALRRPLNQLKPSELKNQN